MTMVISLRKIIVKAKAYTTSFLLEARYYIWEKFVFLKTIINNCDGNEMSFTITGEYLVNYHHDD